MEVVGLNPDRIVEGYSEEFEETFLEHVKRTHRFSRVAVTVVYNEYIAKRHHVLLNSTEWPTLTDFIKYLGRTGKCTVDETPKGWFMAYIDREPKTLSKDKLKNKRQRAELVDEERHERVIAEQIERAAKTVKSGDDQDDVQPDVLIRDEGEEKVAFSLGSTSFLKPNAGQNGSGIPRPPKPSICESGEPEESTDGKENGNGFRNGRENGKHRRKDSGGDALGLIMREQEQVKEKVNRKDYLLCVGLIVKVVSKGLADKGLYEQKGDVIRVISRYVGEIKMRDSGDILKVDQEDLETILPQIGGMIRSALSVNLQLDWSRVNDLLFKVELQNAYDKLYKKYQNLKKRQLADVDGAFDEQSERIRAFTTAADDYVETLKKTNSAWEDQEEMIDRSRLMEAAYIDCQNSLVIERARNLELRKQLENAELSGSKLPENTEPRVTELAKDSEPCGNKLPENAELCGSKLPENTEHRGSKLPENAELFGSKLLQQLLQSALQLTILNYGKSDVTLSHDESGYEFKLEQNKLSEEVGGKDALLYNVVSLGTILHVAPEWMRSEIVFDMAQVRVFFRKIFAVARCGGVSV